MILDFMFVCFFGVSIKMPFTVKEKTFKRSILNLELFLDMLLKFDVI